MRLIEAASDLRYHKAVEDYSRAAVKLNAMRSGAVGTSAAVVARAASHAETTPAEAAPPKDAPAPPPPSALQSALAAVGRGVEAATALEQRLSAPIAAIPTPGFPALRVFDLDVGLPHAHNHPPNLTPPNPVPLPLPSMGPVIPIPILSGASTVLINGQPAARCGDLGLGIFCGGFFPMFEIFFGSASVWTEGARAARVVVDMTKHCTFSAPRPSDPPLGPMIGTTLPPGSPNVLIGGVPMPSLFSMAIAQAFKLTFKVGGKVLRKATAKSYIDDLIKKGTLTLDPSYCKAPAKWTQDMMADLYKIAATRSGRQVLKRLQKSGKNVVLIEHIDHFNKGADFRIHNAWAWPQSTDALVDATTKKPGPGANAIVAHTPDVWVNHNGGKVDYIPSPPEAPPKNSTSDGILLHELNHAANGAEGRTFTETTDTHKWGERWHNFEEYDTVATENGYRRELGQRTRPDYTTPLP